MVNRYPTKLKLAKKPAIPNEILNSSLINGRAGPIRVSAIPKVIKPKKESVKQAVREYSIIIPR